jgi:hypothetical protein
MANSPDAVMNSTAAAAANIFTGIHTIFFGIFTSFHQSKNCLKIINEAQKFLPDNSAGTGKNIH